MVTETEHARKRLNADTTASERVRALRPMIPAVVDHCRAAIDPAVDLDALVAALTDQQKAL